METRYVDDAGGLAEVGSAVASAERIALDCEAAGYHRYSDRLCLVQLTVGSTTFLIDPFTVDPAPILEPVLGGPAPEVLMHGADYDVRLLDRDLGLQLRGLFDTQIAAALVGEETLGLSALLERRLGVRLSKKYQKADWAQRPLPDPMREYAALDTSHLRDLADALRSELEERGRLEWALEECRELEKVRFDAGEPTDPVARMKAARDLTPREVDRLRTALAWRDEVAKELDRAHFRVVGDPALIEVARRSPSGLDDLEGVPGMNRSLARNRGAELLDRLRTVDELPEEALQGLPRPPRNGNGRGRPLPEVEERFARLRDVRNAHAETLGLAKGTLLPNALLQRIAESPPGSPEALAETPGIRRWQSEVLGAALLEVL